MYQLSVYLVTLICPSAWCKTEGHTNNTDQQTCNTIRNQEQNRKQVLSKSLVNFAADNTSGLENFALHGTKNVILLISDKCVNQIGQCTLVCSRFKSPLFQILVPINSDMTTQYHIKYHLGVWILICLIQLTPMGFS